MADLAQKKEVRSAQVQQLLLQHIALAWYRLSRLDETVQQAAFLVMQQMYAAYYAPQDICVQDSRLLALHQDTGGEKLWTVSCCRRKPDIRAANTDKGRNL